MIMIYKITQIFVVTPPLYYSIRNLKNDKVIVLKRDNETNNCIGRQVIILCNSEEAIKDAFNVSFK